MVTKRYSIESCLHATRNSTVQSAKFRRVGSQPTATSQLPQGTKATPARSVTHCTASRREPTYHGTES